MQTTSHCSRGPCPSVALSDGLCGTHYLEQFVKPLEKERDNARATLDKLNEIIRERVAMLEMAARLATMSRADGKSVPFAHCQKCGKGFFSGLDCLRHEEGCYVLPPKAKRPIAARGETVSERSEAKPSKAKPAPAPIVLADADIVCDI